MNTTVPAGRQPDTLVRQALVDVFDRIDDTRDNPPKLRPAFDAACDCVELDNVPGLEQALLDVAAGAVATLVLVRCSA